jgi:hypothetical protein
VITLPALVEADPWLVARGRLLTGTILVDLGDESWLLDVEAGRVTGVRDARAAVMPRWDFALRAPREEWDAFFEPQPRPGHHDLMALRRRQVLQVEGDVRLFMIHLQWLKDVLALLRKGNA